MALQTAPTPPVAASSPAMPSGAGGQADAGDFAGALDSAASVKPGAALGAAIQGLGQRGRKAPGDAASSDSDQAGAEKERVPDAAEPQAAAVTMPLDIAALAQMAAAMPAPMVLRDSAAATPTSGSSTTPGQAGKAAPAAPLAGLRDGAGQGPPGPAAPAAARVPTAASAAAPQTSTGDEPKAGSAASSGREGAVPALPQAVTPPGAATPASLAPQQAAGSLPQGQDPAATAKTPPSSPPAAARATPVTGAVVRDGVDRPATDRSAGAKRGFDPAGTATAVAAPDPGSATPPSPAQQVVTALQSLAPRPSDTASQASSAPVLPTLPAIVSNAGGLKTVTIQLNPGHLGPVSVTLRLRADTVDIQIAVSNPETLHLLDRDRHALAAAVEALGGRDTSLRLDPAEASNEGGMAGNAFTGSDGSSRQQQASSDAASTGRGHQNRSATPYDSQNDADDPKTPAPPVASTRRRDGSLYL